MRTVYNTLIRSSAYYEAKAEEVRTIRDMTRDPWCKKALAGVVEDYMRLAGDALNAERRRGKKAA